uniref:Uncharacterized protein n=1 Tax=Setaria italica TaxID=4555 RepID=K3ZPT3_SETIT
MCSPIPHRAAHAAASSRRRGLAVEQAGGASRPPSGCRGPAQPVRPAKWSPRWLPPP